MVRILPGAPFESLVKDMLIVSDLDGTILEKGSPISEKNRQSFVRAQKLGAVCVIATGKSLRGAQKDLDSAFPIDYLVFSSGAGIYDWKSKELIHRNSLNRTEVEKVYKYLCGLSVDFTIQLEAPNSHHFLFSQNNLNNKDFSSRILQNKEHGKSLSQDLLPERASEFIVIQNNPVSHALFETISRDLSQEFNVVRATSPIDGKSLWIEVFHEKTSKAHASDWLRQKHGFDKKNTFALGNDFNDLQLLAWASHSLVVGDSPSELLQKYRSVCHHSQGALEEAIQFWMNEVMP